MPIFQSVAEVLVGGVIANVEGRSDLVEQVYHFTFARAYDPATLPTLSAVANAVTADIATPMLGVLHQDYTWSYTKARWMDDIEVAYALGTDTIGSGTITTARLPSDVTVRIQLHTNTRGKNFKGGKSYRPLAEDQVTADALTAPALAAFNAFGAAVIGAPVPSGQTMYPIIVSRSRSQLQTNPTTIIASLIQQFTVNKSLGTMRGKHRRSVT